MSLKLWHPRPQSSTATSIGDDLSGRIRKTRCDGTKPNCKTCEVYQTECRYEQPPPMSQIVDMAKRLQEAEATIVALRMALDQMSTDPRKSKIIESGAISSQTSAVAEAPTHSLSGTYTEAPFPTHESIRSVAQSRGCTNDEFLSDLSLDASGKVCHHGATSAVHDPATISTLSPAFRIFRGQNSNIDVRVLLTSNAEALRAWEDFSIGNAALLNNMPRDLMSRLLRRYWTTIDPMFLWVYRPAFMRDMMTGGQYCSPLLLNVMCGHAAHFDESGLAEILVTRARHQLEAEVHKQSSISTIQALLQLSAGDLACGQVSQAWTYSGIAFRMAHDMGLRQSSGAIYHLGNLNAEDLEIRKRCFWSCYFWDKAISIFLGRMPVLTELPSAQYPELMDDFQEHDLWDPDDASMADPNNVNPVFPATKLHTVSAFANACKLAVIINDVIFCLYSRRHGKDIDAISKAITERLHLWRALTPDHLKIDPNNLPDVCPAPHIVSQNLLYYATTILVHRPFTALPVHHATCCRAAEYAEKLILLQERTHGVTQLPLMSAYCIYTAASALVQDAKAGEPIASRRLETFLRVLATAAKTSTLIQRSMAIITSRLQSNSTALLPVIKPEQPSNDEILSMQRLPAFLCQERSLDYIAHANVDGIDFNTSSLLDCHPKQHAEILSSTKSWFMSPRP